MTFQFICYNWATITLPKLFFSLLNIFPGLEILVLRLPDTSRFLLVVSFLITQLIKFAQSNTTRLNILTSYQIGVNGDNIQL